MTVVTVWVEHYLGQVGAAYALFHPLYLPNQYWTTVSGPAN